MPTIPVEIMIDVPAGVTVGEYERIDNGHSFHVSWEFPEGVIAPYREFAAKNALESLKLRLSPAIWRNCSCQKKASCLTLVLSHYRCQERMPDDSFYHKCA